MKSKAFISILLFLISQWVTAQKQDGLDFDTLSVYDIAINSLHFQVMPEGTPQNFCLDDFQIYHPVVRNFLMSAQLGNIGQAHFSPYFTFREDVGFSTGLFETSSLFMLNLDGLSVYRTNKRFTNIKYVNGAKRENFIIAEHSQNLGPFFTFGFKFKRVSSEGFYNRQTTRFTDLSANMRLRSKDNRYHFLVNGIWNTGTREENGGIANDEEFLNDSVSNRQLVEISLSDAESRITTRKLLVQHHFDFGESVEVKKEDSTITEFIPRLRIGHRFRFGYDAFVYVDNQPASGFYENIYIDSTQTFDSLRTDLLSNQLDLTWFGKKAYADSISNFNKNYVRASVEHEIRQLTQDSLIDMEYNNIILKSELGFHLPIIDELKAKTQYALQGYNQGDFLSKVHLRKYLKGDSISKPFVELELLTTRQEPDFIYQRYFSNHFVWVNDFDKTLTQKAGLQYVHPKWKLETEAEFLNVTNYTYFDTARLPQQFGESINIIRLSAHKKFLVGKFGFNNHLTYQAVEDGLPVRLPAIIIRESIFYENRFFENNLLARFGVDVFFNSRFQAKAYIPANGQFHIQNEVKTGAYPYVDVYASFRIKTVRFFLKLEHVNAGLLESNYIMVPHYPLNDRALKFGLNWTFFD